MRKYLSWPRKHKWLAGTIAVLAVVVVGVGIIAPANDKHEKKDFIQARSAIDAIYADIVANIGQPDDHKSSDSCSSGYSGPYNLITDCVISTNFIFGVKDHQGAIDLSAKIESLIGAHSSLLQARPAPESDIPNTPAPSNYSDSHINWYKTRHDLSCSYGYVYDRQESTGLKLKKSSEGQKSFSAGISCVGEAKEEYYSHT